MDKEKIIDNLTADQEATLRDIHAENYHGLDDDMPENFEKWLENLTVMDLEAYLEL